MIATLLAVSIVFPAPLPDNFELTTRPKAVLRRIWQRPTKLVAIDGNYVVFSSDQSKTYEIARADNGKTISRFTAGTYRFCGDVLVYETRNDTPELVGLELPGAKEKFRFRVGDIGAIGGIHQNRVFYIEGKDLKVAALPGGEVLQSRTLPNSWGPHIYGIEHGRVYVNWTAHEVAALHLDDISKGWRSYCDPSRVFLDERGFVVSVWHHNLGRVDLEGKTVWFQSPTQTEFLSGNIYAWGDWVVANALDYKRVIPDYKTYSDVTTVYPRLYAFDRFTGEIRWSQPLYADSPRIFGNLLATITMRRDRSVKRKVIEGRQQWPDYIRTIEIRELETGTLLQTLPVTRNEKGRQEVGISTNGKILLVNMNGKATAYQPIVR